MYYLLDNPNPNGNKFYTTRNSALTHIVVHTAENLPDVDGQDGGAERVARYLASTSRDASCHECVDSDSYVPMLPDSYTAWHARGFNACGWGLEICTRAASWDHTPMAWRDKIILAAAIRARRVADQYDIPIRRVTSKDTKGFIAHADIDPTRRSDPGANFPWQQFLDLVRVGTGPAPTPIKPPAPRPPGGDWMASLPVVKRGHSGDTVRRVQALLYAVRHEITIDGDFGPGTERHVKVFQKARNLAVDGIVGDNTWKRLVAG